MGRAGWGGACSFLISWPKTRMPSPSTFATTPGPAGSLALRIWIYLFEKKKEKSLSFGSTLKFLRDFGWVARLKENQKQNKSCPLRTALFCWSQVSLACCGLTIPRDGWPAGSGSAALG